MTNINLKHILQGLFELKEHITELYQSIKIQVGDEANYIREWYDLRRVERDEPDATEIEGDALFAEVLQFCWKTSKDYVWHYHDQRFRITPFKSGTTDDGGFIFYYGVKHNLVNFASVTRDAVDTDCSVWEAIVARMHGIADGYVSAMKDSLRNEENLKKAVQDGRLTKVLADMPAPDAETVPDGTLACGDKPAEPVVDQAEGRLIRAGGPSPERFG